MKREETMPLLPATNQRAALARSARRQIDKERSTLHHPEDSRDVGILIANLLEHVTGPHGKHILRDLGWDPSRLDVVPPLPKTRQPHDVAFVLAKFVGASADTEVILRISYDVVRRTLGPPHPPLSP